MKEIVLETERLNSDHFLQKILKKYANIILIQFGKDIRQINR